MTKLPRLELTEDPNKNNDFIIFRYQIKGKKQPKPLSEHKVIKTISSHKKRDTYKSKRKRTNKTRKHKRKSIFNIF